MRRGRIAIASGAGWLLAALALNDRSGVVDAMQSCELSSLGNGSPPLEVDLSTGPHTCGLLKFAWQGFLAMNWPAQDLRPEEKTHIARGLPDTTLVIGQGDEK